MVRAPRLFQTTAAPLHPPLLFILLVSIYCYLPPSLQHTPSEASERKSPSLFKVSSGFFIIKSKQHFLIFLSLILSHWWLAASSVEYFLPLAFMTQSSRRFLPASDHSSLCCRFILLKSNQSSLTVVDSLLREPIAT